MENLIFKVFIGKSHLTFEKMNTMLTHLPQLPSYFSSLFYPAEIIPSHFSIEDVLTDIFKRDLTTMYTNWLNRWTHIYQF